MRLIVILLLISGIVLGLNAALELSKNDMDKTMTIRHLDAKKSGEVCYEIKDPYDVRGKYCLEYMR